MYCIVDRHRKPCSTPHIYVAVSPCTHQLPPQCMWLLHSLLDCADYVCLSVCLSILNPDCGAPDTPANGAVQLSAKNQIATFSCGPGYQLEGNSTHVCQQSGEWSGQLPFCTREPWEETV